MPDDTPAAREPSDIERAAQQLARGMGQPIALVEARAKREEAVTRFFNGLTRLADEAVKILQLLISQYRDEEREREERARQVQTARARTGR